METGLNIIVQNTYISYENALKKLKAKRMNLIYTSFGKKALKVSVLKTGFHPNHLKTRLSVSPEAKNI